MSSLTSDATLTVNTVPLTHLMSAVSSPRRSFLHSNILYVNSKSWRYSPFLALWWQEDQSLPTENWPHGSFPLHMGPVPGQLQAEIHPQWLCYSGWTTCAFQREDPASAVYAEQARQVRHKDLLGLWCTHPICNWWDRVPRETTRGRHPEESGENIVRQLCSGFRHTGRNITTDNFFTSVPLAEHLLEKGLTIVGTLQQNKPDIPPVMKASRSREVHSTEFGFNGSMTMISYVRKKGKAVLLLSTMHHSKMVDEKTRSDPLLQPDQRRSRYYGPDGWQLHLQTPDAEVAHGALVQHDWCRRSECLFIFEGSAPWILHRHHRWTTTLPHRALKGACDTSHEKSTGRYPDPTNLHHWSNGKVWSDKNCCDPATGKKHTGPAEEKEVPVVSKKQRSQSHWLLLEMQYSCVQWSHPEASSLWQLHTVKGDKMFVCVHMCGQCYGLRTCWMFSVRPPDIGTHKHVLTPDWPDWLIVKC